MKRQSDEKTKNTFIQTLVYRLYPSKADQVRFQRYCDYHRYVWNEYKYANDHAYQRYRYERTYYAKVGMKVKAKEFCSKYPTFARTKKQINHDKKAWEYKYPSKIALMAMTDYDNAMSSFINKAMPDWGKPKFRSKHSPRQGFKLPAESLRLNGRTITVAKGRKDKKHNNLVLKSRQSFLDYPIGTVSFYTEKGRYYVAVPYFIPKEELKSDDKLKGRAGIDLNVDHYDIYDGQHRIIDLNMKQLKFYYERIKHYQRLLARKREFDKKNIGSHNYLETRAKLQRDYRRVADIQNDFLQKLVIGLCQKYGQIVIEDLDVKHMKMGVASKGLHRSMFGAFRNILTYKSEQYGNYLVVADRFYPLTQICSKCQYRKTGDEKISLWGNKKHHTKHNEYVCYNCGNNIDRDENASINLYQYLDSQWYKEKSRAEKQRA